MDIYNYAGHVATLKHTDIHPMIILYIFEAPACIGFQPCHPLLLFSNTSLVVS